MLDAVAELVPKQCFVCGAAVATSAFTPRVYCRDCRKASKSVRSAARYLANREEIRRKAAARYAANPEPVKAKTARRYAEKKPDVIAKMREWQRSNPDKVAIKTTKWKKANRDKVRKAERLRYKKNPEIKARRAIKEAKRRALKRLPYAEHVSIQDIISRDGPRCYICGVRTDPRAKSVSPIKSHLEHVIPLALGGQHIRGNLRCACRRCNMLKGAKHSPEVVATLLLEIPIAT